MGSGLILLVIVGAWLAVLVPMALRSHDASTSLGTVDKFHDAMRVLSRRGDGDDPRGRDADDDVAPAPAPDERPRAARRAADRADVAADAGRSGFGPAPALRRRTSAPAAAAAPVRTGLTPAARRRRALVVLLVLVLGSLVGAVLGPVWVWGLHAVADLLLVGFLAWLRHETVLRAEREWRTAMQAPQQARRTAAASPVPAASVAPRIEVGVPGRIAGIPDRMPAHALVDPRWSLPVPDAPAPARGAQGEPWQPVPVPVPTYVNAPTAPRRDVGVARASGRPADLAEAERSLGIDDRGPDLDQILGRAVGD